MKDVVEIAKYMKRMLAGHLARIQDGRWTVRVTEWTGTGRPATRWKGEVDQFFNNPTWRREDQDRREWRLLAEAFVQQWNTNML